MTQLTPEAQFILIGIDEFNRNNYLKNDAKRETIVDVIAESGLADRLAADKASAANAADIDKFKVYGPALLLVANLPNAEKDKKWLGANRKLIARYCLGKFKQTIQAEAAVALVKKVKLQPLDEQTVDKECGIGIEVTQDQIVSAVKDFIKRNEKVLLDNRWTAKVGSLLGQLRKEIGQDPVMKWADASKMKDELEKQVNELWGPKPEGDEATAAGAGAGAGGAKLKNVFADQRKAVNQALSQAHQGSFAHVQFEARELDSAVNSEQLLEAHRKATGSTPVVTRFPPEPNGYLHIGHAKAMNLSFGYAKEMGGYTILRFDDTNPEAEESHFFDAIIEMVHWLGFKPAKITATSDYFDHMYEFALKLIKEGKAYVDFSSKEEIKRQRDEMIESPYRNTGIEENLREFENMRRGKYAEGKAVLRVKIDMKHPNPNMRDFLAYRVKYHAHARTGNKWCIYPTYDYSHCIVDSLEWITHSLCTLEFEIRRDSYYWLLQALDLYRPHVWEFSRLNISRSMLSKRKVNKLVKEGTIRGWDDPRLLTLAGLRRRGYTPEAIKKLCFDVGVSRAQNVIPIDRLENALRADLDERCDRAFAILDPLRVVLEDLAADAVEYTEAPVHPRREDRGKRKLPITRVFYIEKKDFKETDDPDFFGMVPGKEVVGLRYVPFRVSVTGYTKDPATGEVVEVRVRKNPNLDARPKGFIHWLGQVKPGVDPMRAEVRLYDYLFKDTPTDENWLELLDRSSETVVRGAFVENLMMERPENRVPLQSKLQFERLGYFSVDADSTADRLVLNRAVTLKEGYAKSKPADAESK